MLDKPLRPEFRTQHHITRDLLLAIWCTEKNNCDKAKCSLGRCISKIDEQLRSGRFTFRGNNHEVVQTPSLFKEFLGVDNLTKQQYDLINSTENFLWINGPAGSGKTVVLMAKVLQLVLSSELNKVVLICATYSTNKISSDYFQTTLEKAGIKHVSVVLSKICNPFTIYREITSHFLDNQVVILKRSGFDYDINFNQSAFKSLGVLLGLLEGVNIFFDDMQGIIRSNPGVIENDFGFIKTVFKFSRSHYVWVVCDTIQSGFCVDAQPVSEPTKGLARFTTTSYLLHS